MTFGVLSIAVATCLASVSIVDSEVINRWNTWPTMKLPTMHTVPLESHAAQIDETNVLQPRAAFDKLMTDGDVFEVGDYHFDLKDIERSLSFQQASAKNLTNIHRTRVTIDDAKELLNLKLMPGGNEAQTDHPVTRRKRHIFGDDTRYQITKDFRKIFPFSAVVQLSTGCSGILIGPKHVLTAAECIHNGRRYRGSAKNLRVGLIHIANISRPSTVSPNNVRRDVDVHGLDWYEVEQLYIPNGWLSPTYGQKRETFNYAVLELEENHNLNCMEVGVSSSANTGHMQRIHFSSFDDFEYNPDPVLAYRHCNIVDDTQNYLYEKCDSTKSSVGAGVYLRMWDSENWKWSRRVMAVKTSENERIRVKGKMTRTGRDVRITLLNFAQICYWVMRDFEVCSRGRIEDACLMA